MVCQDLFFTKHSKYIGSFYVHNNPLWSKHYYSIFMMGSLWHLHITFNWELLSIVGYPFGSTRLTQWNVQIFWARWVWVGTHLEELFSLSSYITERSLVWPYRSRAKVKSGGKWKKNSTTKNSKITWKGVVGWIPFSQKICSGPHPCTYECDLTWNSR